MKKPRRIELLAYAALFLATAGNLGFQYLHKSDGGVVAQAASRLELGSALPALHLKPLSHAPGAEPASARQPLPAGCRMLVVFHPDCPHCHTAAQREAAAKDRKDHLPIVWVSGFDDAKARAFESREAAGLPVRYDRDAPSALKVSAVPVYVLVGADDRVKFWGAFSGTENHAELRRKC